SFSGATTGWSRRSKRRSAVGNPDERSEIRELPCRLAAESRMSRHRRSSGLRQSALRRPEPMNLSFVPDLHVLAAYTAAAILLILTPGADMTFFLGQTLAAGRARGFAAMLGVSAGLVVHSIAAAFGLSALLAASATAFGVLKIVGVLYLIFL